jgi:hypothetical protein
MAFVLNDRVKETTTTAGTGTVDLAGAETGFESFVAGIGNSNTTYYAIVHQSLDEFEVGLGTITDASPDTLARTTVISSSNSDSAVNFSAGTKDVFCTLPASKAVVEDGSDNIALGAAPTISNASGDLTLDVAGTIILDSSQNVNLYANGTHFAYLQNENSDFRIGPIIQDKDFIVRGNDGGTYVDGLKIDFSDAGRATLHGGAHFPNNTDIEFATGTNTWSGEKGAKIQNHNNVFYIQFTTLFATRNSSGTSVTSVDTSGNGIFKGNVTAYGTPSDIKLKKDIKVIDNAVDKVKQLQGITYTLKSDGNRLTGLIAQDLEKVLPEAVYTSGTISDEINGIEAEEHLAIRYGNTVGLLVEAIKEQQEQIETLTAKVKELEDK